MTNLVYSGAIDHLFCMRISSREVFFFYIYWPASIKKLNKVLFCYGKIGEVSIQIIQCGMYS